MSSDPNIADFHDRIARIQKDHARGYGFEAAGTLGRSHYLRPVQRRRSILKPALIVLLCGLGLKGAIHSRIGADNYERRVDVLMQGEGFDRLGGILMQADPATVYVSHQIARMFSFPIDV